jgi:hypothetical protein
MLDALGWSIVTTHQMLGHEKTAAVFGVPPGDASACVICRFERTLSEEDRQAVITALSPA